MNYFETSISKCYTDFESKISYIIFLHDYLLACEISTVRILALRLNPTIRFPERFV